jgi:sugar phosphate isomerase/epimerase
MKVNNNLHLAYCTNVHPGEDWAQTFDSLNRHTLAVKAKLEVRQPYAIGLRLSDQASRELAEPAKLLEFQRWLDQHDCYIFTINGFPFGRFHGGPVKERVYLPDWTDPQRLEYTNRLFDLLGDMVPTGIEGSVSTLPGSFKDFVNSAEQRRRIRDNLWRCVEHVARTRARTGRVLHLGLEPEPLGLFENTDETLRFFDELRTEHAGDERLEECLGVNYDTCHFAVEFEEPQTTIARLRQYRIRISKIHLSNALKLHPSRAALARLLDFAEDVYLHQVIARQPDGSLVRFKDLGLALASSLAQTPHRDSQWRVHFHIPLHSRPPVEFQSTSDHVLGLLNELQSDAGLCSHLEMETYTWAVLPKPLRAQDVSDQLVAEYRWTLKQLADRNLGP